MELRCILFIGCYLTFIQANSPVSLSIVSRTQKRAIPSYSNSDKLSRIEGSGLPEDERSKNLAAADIEWEGSGISPDDEDGDVVEGSGADSDDVGGSGDKPFKKLPKSDYNITRTTTARPQVYIDDDGEQRRNHHVIVDPSDDSVDVVIEEAPTIISKVIRTTTITTLQPRIPVTTSKRPPLLTTMELPPLIASDASSIPFDFLLKPGVLAALIGGIVVGILAAILLVMFIIYRMRKKDEGSYALDEPKQPPHYSYAYQKAPTKEFYA